MCASVNMYMSWAVSVIYDFMSLCGSVDANVNCEFMYLFKCELCEFRSVFTWRARAGPGSFVGRAFRAGPARMGLCSAVLGHERQPVGRHGPARLTGRAQTGRAQTGRAQTGSGWAGPCRPFGHLYVR
jgi:hypothetical protein